MQTYDAREVELLVFTFKDGLLSKVAHDLQIRAQRLTLTVEGDHAVRLEVDVRGLRVVQAMVERRPAPELLSPRDKSKIEDILTGEELLDAKQHPVVRFRSTRITESSDGYELEGELTLRGQTRRLRADLARIGGRLETEVRLVQTDFGIRPYTALLGALRVQPEVRVRLSVPYEP